MADFVAVLRKTIGALGENTPEMRDKVFEKARATIEAKLAAIDPPPPAAVVERQRKALEDAIAVVRADYATAEAEKDDALEDVFASLRTMGEVKSPAVPPQAAEKVEAAASAPAAASPGEEAAIPAAPAEAESRAEGDAADAPAEDAAGEVQGPPPRPEVVVAAASAERKARSGSGRRTGLVAALILLLVVAGAGYAVWLNRDDFSRLVGLAPTPVATAPDGVDAATEPEEPVTAEPEQEAESEIAAVPPAEEEPPATGEEPAAAEETPPAEEEQEASTPPVAAPEQSAAAPEPEKFTQRLMPDGTEIDEGPAGGQRTIGEGSSVAVAQASDPAAAETTEGAQQPVSPVVAVGQRAIFYEERTSTAQGSAEIGTIVWSMVRESPGGDQPPEPAIRAEATIPGKDLQLRMTIRRNGDQTLPAAHVVEMIFLTPDGFEGGAIASVSRIAFKETEQAAGSPLQGIPAKIADGFFLIALSDTPAEVEANTTLLRSRNWVDIPIVYQSGRRALLSMEKGIPGERVFEEAMRAWDEADSGDSG